MSRHLIFCVLILSLLAVAEIHADGPQPPMPPPQTQMKSHTAGNLNLVITNWGYFGNTGNYDTFPWSLEFPSESGQDYLFQGALWIGAVVNSDTLVSVGTDGWIMSNEFFPGTLQGDTIVQRSISKLSPYFHPDAISEQDLISTFTDTFCPYTPPDHVPLEMRITQHSYCWSSYWIEDFVLVRLQIENIREDQATLEDMYAAIYLDGDVVPTSVGYMCRHYCAQDDITGFRRWRHESDSLWAPGAVVYQWDGTQYVPVDVGETPKYRSPCDGPGIAWIADDDGDHPDSLCPPADPSLSVVGTRAISLPQEKTSYHWWFSDPNDQLDWGPFKQNDPRDFEGTPMGDLAKYRIMSNGYIDPDQVCDGVEYPPGVDSINDTRYMISFGPHELAFGETLEVVWAFVGGERFHNGHEWCEWEFADLIMNGNRAYAVYDNPGIDTDSNGYFGDYMIIDDDTLYLTGDGVPDYKECDYPPWNPCDMIVGVEEEFSKASGRSSELRQNFPNPFSGFTSISFSIPRKTHTRLEVFDVCGRLVSSIVDENLRAGRHTVRWNSTDNDGRPVTDGVYFYRLTAAKSAHTRKMVVIR